MDHELFRTVNRFAVRTGWLHDPATAYAKYGVVIFAALLVVAWLRARHAGDLQAEAGLGWAGVATLISLGIGQIVGHLADRARPYSAMPHVELLVAKTADFSFPSDHALTVGAVAVGLWLVDRRIGAVALVLAILMAFTRVYVGAHYPADVVAGLVISAVVVLVGARPGTRLLREMLEQMERLPGIAWLTGRRQASAT